MLQFCYSRNDRHLLRVGILKKVQCGGGWFAASVPRAGAGGSGLEIWRAQPEGAEHWQVKCILP
jgi:hypothetical protein